MLTSSDRNQYQDVSRKSAENFVQTALDALSAHVAILNDEGEIIRVNAAWSSFGQANGYKNPQSGIGINYLAVCDAASVLNSPEAPLIASGIRDILAGKTSEFELEYPCHSPTEKRWFVVHISRFEWYGETRLIIAHQNISELKLTQHELAESKQRIQAIVDNINNGILTINSAGYVETANPAADRIFGYNTGTLPGMHLSQLMSEAVASERSSLKRLHSDEGHELVGIRKDGSQFPLYFALSELKLDNLHIFTCIVRDITLQRQMEAERIEHERVSVALEKEREMRDLKNRFLSMMSHELQTPLASIGLSHDMLNKYGHIATEEERQQALDNIRTQVNYLSSMVTDVITLSKGESLDVTLEIEPTNFITYCRDIVEEFEFNYQATHNIHFECDEAKIRLPIDRRIMRRVMNNLLSNAVKYSPEGGDVIFRLCVVENEVMIQVQDSGIGIPESDQKRLFTPFHRAKNTGEIHGTGLGLAITKQTVEQHGGTINFESSKNGTTFIVQLPLPDNT